MDLRLKGKYLAELKENHSNYTLGKAMNHDLATKLLKGEVNITLKNFVKLCEIMGWDIPEQIKDIDKEK